MFKLFFSRAIPVLILFSASVLCFKAINALKYVEHVQQIFYLENPQPKDFVRLVMYLVLGTIFLGVIAYTFVYAVTDRRWAGRLASNAWIGVLETIIPGSIYCIVCSLGVRVGIAILTMLKLTSDASFIPIYIVLFTAMALFHIFANVIGSEKGVIAEYHQKEKERKEAIKREEQRIQYEEYCKIYPPEGLKSYHGIMPWHYM
ncbi:MAG: hypothetical protein WCQ32_02300 [bacterium]